MKIFSAIAASAVAHIVLAGCESLQFAPRVDVAPVKVQPTPPPAQPVAGNGTNKGAIFEPMAYRPLFEDHRARLPGDTIMVNIVENITASARSTSSVDKSGSVDAGVTALPGFSAAKVLGRATAAGTTAQAFEGKGATESSNTFTGNITAVVVGVMPNGHLQIAGEKQIGVNANVDVLRFSGQIDPRSIQPGNAVASTQIANVRLEQKSRGQQGEAQSIGWLSRFFLNVLPI